ncbi:hypothetical protein AB0B94_30635 [Micromonospora sp. NPDC048986]|uniref:hypothetical protein n=1 Tax=Micromonospora sp. NPDC048986 TaxID=3155644 RepID=UPI00340E3BC6
MSKRRPRPHRSTPLVRATPTPYSNEAFRTAVAESAPAAVAEPSTHRADVREATLGGATVTSPGRILIRLIRAGWSLNSNYWPAEVLRRDGPTAWPKGTLAYIDHAPEGEEEAYPSGSIRNLAAVLTTDARWDDAEQALFAEARLFHPWRETITDMADAIGMSIRAWVTCSAGEAEGREGEIIDSIPQGRSVDFVTVPAAGGGIVSVLEAVGHRPVAEARNAGHWFESRIHSSFTEVADRMFGEGYLTRDERIILSNAVGDALAAFAARIELAAPHLYERDPWQEPEVPALAQTSEAAPDGAPNEGAEPTDDGTAPHPTEDVTDGVPPTAPNPPTEQEPDMSGTDTGTPVQAGTATVADAPVTNPTAEAAPTADAITAAVQAALATALAPMQQQLADATARANQRDAENQAMRNTNRANEAVAAALRAPALADVTAQIGPRVTSRVLAAIPTADNGAVDENALGEAIAQAVTDEAAFVRNLRAEALESAGVGSVYGLGASTVEEAPQDGLNEALNGLFNTIGMSEAQTAVAMKGRG